jgi:hypothetical protein
MSWYFFQALAQDQRTALEQLLWACPGLQHIKVATYDGDTPQDHRRGKPATFCVWHLVISPAIRETASVIFTNFVRMRKQVSPSFLTLLWRTCCTPLYYLMRSFGGRELLCVFNWHCHWLYSKLHKESQTRSGRWIALLFQFIWEVSFMVAPFHSSLIKFPSHVAQIIRRFRRICAAVGSMFQFSWHLFHVFVNQIFTRPASYLCIMQCHHIEAKSAYETSFRGRGVLVCSSLYLL